MDKTGELASETGLLMLGATHPNEFVGNLATRLEIDKKKAKEIADDINREIFAPVRQHLRALFADANEGTDQPTPPAAQKPVPPSGMNHESGIMNYGKEKLDSGKHAGSMFYRGNDKVSAEKPSDSEFQVSGSRLQNKETSFEDLEAELKKQLEEEGGGEPFSIVTESLAKEPAPTASLEQVPKAPPPYKGPDPYREPVEDTLPNVAGKPYAPPAQNHESGIMKYGEKEEKPSGFQVSGSRLQDKEQSPFSPVQPPPQQPQQKPDPQKRDPYREKLEEAAGVTSQGTLKSFRGANIAEITKQQAERKENGQKNEL